MCVIMIYLQPGIHDIVNLRRIPVCLVARIHSHNTIRPRRAGNFNHLLGINLPDFERVRHAASVISKRVPHPLVLIFSHWVATAFGRRRCLYLYIPRPDDVGLVLLFQDIILITIGPWWPSLFDLLFEVNNAIADDHAGKSIPMKVRHLPVTKRLSKRGAPINIVVCRRLTQELGQAPDFLFQEPYFLVDPSYVVVEIDG
ncbi:hypothetical protein V1520DRAFT_171628 [Lipomyces starkeyi]|uniref:Uncharacterized protein n=1 Tax=Lipomyces starkeyi NRRL Y-11557 TaxID=675824 RepID=A0A1E3Q959_LIPST|nr:hypothetical protein LIPSTDRAFT_246181 [Lipomyces starkeyi NRRL Y-11557]